jgi:hypothetical protein
MIKGKPLKPFVDHAMLAHQWKENFTYW